MKAGVSGTALRHLRELFSGRTVIGLTDAQLLERYAASNDGEAFEALMARHGPMVLATCRALLMHDHDVEDAFQSTFFVLACKARSVSRGDALGGWLRRVAHRAAVQASVDANQRRRREAEVAAMGTSDVTHPEDKFEWRSILQEEIGRLPEGQRLPVLLCDVEGLTYDQAAHQLHWTVPTLRCRLAKARKRLRARLTRRGLSPALLGHVIAPQQTPATVPAAWTSAAVAAATGETTSAAVAALSRVIVRGMLITRLKIAGTVLLTVVALVSVGVVAVSAGQSNKPDPAPVALAVVEAPKGAKNAPVPETTPGMTFEYQGRVLGPDGQPVAGARLYVASQVLGTDQAPRQPVGRATTGVDGRFDFEVPGADFDATWTDEPWKYAAVIATADGFAPALAIDFGVRRDLTLRLVKDDLTVEGRILDTDGRPVADAKVQVVMLLWPKSGGLTEWSAALKAEQGASTTEYRLLHEWDVQSGSDLFPVIATGADGRFTLKGIGRERVARLLISGPTIESKIVQVVTRPFETSHIPRFFRGARPERVIYYGPRFDHVAGPTQVVVGTVRDRDTGKPLAGVRVQGTNSFSNKDRFVVGTTSDAEGHYRLSGLPRQREGGPWSDAVVALPPRDKPYLTARLPLGDPPGPGALTLDFALKQGVWVTGRITDQGTGKPTRGAVAYFVFQDNPHLNEVPDLSFGPHNGQVPCDRDGRYRLPAMPGRGLVAARASEDRSRTVQSLSAPRSRMATQSR
jgi:RNA polymerase sigma factor (sigma-70 family)